MILRLGLVLISLACASLVDAATLYVNNSGSPACSDSTNKASNTASAPWCTVGRAAWGNAVRASANASEAASAGDTVLVTAGTYSTAGTGTRNDPAFNPVNSGTAGNLITFQAVGTVTLQLSSSDGPTFGAYAVDYIKWKGFSVDEANATAHSDTGTVVIWDSTGSVIEDCTIDGNGDPLWGDNHNGIRLEAAVDPIVRNNTIHDVYTSTVNGHNGAGIMTYSVRGALIENNTIYNAGAGIFVKGESTVSQHSFTIRYNLIHDVTGKGIYFANATENNASLPSTITQNIIYGCGGYGIIISSDVSSIHYVTVSNNTVNDCVLNLSMRNATGANDLAFTNNISSNPGASGENFNAGDVSSHTAWSADYNLYYARERWSYNSSSYTTLANWRTAISDEANSSLQDPLFVSVGTYDFHLQAGSPALTASSTGGPVGAYITGSETIGAGASSSGATVIPGGSRFTGSVRIQ